MKINTVALHPGLARLYKEKVANLVAALNADGTREEAAGIIRGLIERIILHPDSAAPNGHRIELYGELGTILQLGATQSSTNGNAHLSGGRMRQVTVVAGAGFEPAAFRL